MHHGWWPVYFFPNVVEKKPPCPIDLIDTVTLTATYTLTKLAFDFQ